MHKNTDGKDNAENMSIKKGVKLTGVIILSIFFFH